MLSTDASTTLPRKTRPKPAPAGPAAWAKLLTLLGYCVVALIIAGAWRLRDQHLIVAQSGIGYWLGIAGTTLMVLLLLYPLRKRVRLLRHFGPVRHWFRLHMLFGIIGPTFIILHSNFQLGSFNGRVALFCTIVVASSGIVGRYLYAKVHHGLYGSRADINSLRADVESIRAADSSVVNLLPAIVEDLFEYESRHLTSDKGVIGSFITSFAAEFQTRWLALRLRRKISTTVNELAGSSAVLAEHAAKLKRNAVQYTDRRLAALRKYAQFRANERLFSLWHVVHYPLFLIMVVAVIVHVVAVHMY